MEENNNENSDSSNGDNGEGGESDIDPRLAALEEKNRQLFERAKKAETELKSLRKPKEDVQESVSRSDELTDGQLALLRADGIRTKAEITLVKEMMAQTGKSLLDVLDNKYFKAELQEMRDQKAAEDATPSTTRRGQAARDSTEYHLAEYLKSGKLPADRAMAEKVLEARINQTKTQNEFTDQPVIMPGYTRQ